MCPEMHTHKHMPRTKTLRVSLESYAALCRFASERGTSLIATVDQLVEEAECDRFWEAMDAYFAALQGDPRVLADYQAESEALATAVADGLDEWPWEED